MIFKRHVANRKSVLAICDEPLIGKKIEDGSLVLDLSSGFYKGTSVKKEDIIPFLKSAYIINAVGDESTSLLLSEKIISKEDVRVVATVPFVQVLREE